MNGAHVSMHYSYNLVQLDIPQAARALALSALIILPIALSCILFINAVALLPTTLTMYVVLLFPSQYEWLWNSCGNTGFWNFCLCSSLLLWKFKALKEI